MSRVHAPYLYLSSFLLAVACGCGGEPHGQVSGQVTLDGKPLEQGTIIFEGGGLPTATGKIEGGNIVSVSSDSATDGLKVGNYQVAIQSLETPTASAVVTSPGDVSSGSMASMSGKSLLPDRYGNPATSQLTAEIKAGPNSLNFPLTSK